MYRGGICSSRGVNCRGVKPSPGMVETVVGVQLDVDGSVSGDVSVASAPQSTCGLDEIQLHVSYEHMRQERSEYSALQAMG